MEKLQKKIVLSGKIQVVTGLHIGGSSSSMEIGGLDQNNIIKTANGVPYVPGSSLKGKLRNMLAKAYGSKDVETDTSIENGCIARIFGKGANDKFEGRSEALLRVRDAYLLKESLTEMEDDLEFEFSEVKYENSIDRVSGKANPRPIERVPSGAEFEFEMIYDAYEGTLVEDDLKRVALAMNLLQKDFLGGAGSRGSGKINFRNVDATAHVIYVDELTIKKEESVYSEIFKEVNELDLSQN